MRMITIAAALLFAIGSADSAFAAKQYLTVSPLDLAPNNLTDLDNATYANAEEFATSGPSMTCWGTGLNFPKGAARVTKLYLYFQSDDTSDLIVYMSRKDMRTNNIKYLVPPTVTQDSDTYTFAVLPIGAFNAVDNGTFVFGMDVCIKGGTRFNGALLEYTVP